MVQVLAFIDLGELVLWSGLIAMFLILLFVISVYVPDDKRSDD